MDVCLGVFPFQEESTKVPRADFTDKLQLKLKYPSTQYPSENGKHQRKSDLSQLKKQKSNKRMLREMALLQSQSDLIVEGKRPRKAKDLEAEDDAMMKQPERVQTVKKSEVRRRPGRPKKLKVEMNTENVEQAKIGVQANPESANLSLNQIEMPSPLRKPEEDLFKPALSSSILEIDTS